MPIDFEIGMGGTNRDSRGAVVLCAPGPWHSRHCKPRRIGRRIGRRIPARSADSALGTA